MPSLQSVRDGINLVASAIPFNQPQPAPHRPGTAQVQVHPARGILPCINFPIINRYLSIKAHLLQSLFKPLVASIQERFR